MKIEKAHLATHFLGQDIKLLHRELALWPLRLWTEQTIKIAYIGYFKIASRNHHPQKDSPPGQHTRTEAPPWVSTGQQAIVFLYV